jgi:hypothetical protein
MPILPFISQTYQHRSRNVSSKRTLNLYTEGTEGEGKDPVVLIGTPGTQTWTRNVVSNLTILTIAGDGDVPNVVSVETTAVHGYVLGQIINISGTANYDENNLVVTSIVSTTEFKYQTFNNTESVGEAVGSIASTGESPIIGAASNDSCRGLYNTSTGRLFGCFGPTVYEFFSDGTSTSRFVISDSSTAVSMTDDGVSLVFVDGFVMRSMALDTNIVTAVDTQTQAGFQNPSKVVFLNQRTVVINNDPTLQNNNKFFWTDIRDATTIDPLSFATAESSADPIISVEVRQGELWFFGPRSYEIWAIDTNPDLPYRYVGGSSTEIGCGAKSSTSSIADQVFWLGSSRAGQNVVYVSNGYGARRISTHAVEYFLNTQGNKTSDSVGFTYQTEGHTFYILNLLQSNKTFVFDLSTGQWHERSTRDAQLNIANRWDPLFSVFAFGQVLVGSQENPRIFLLDLDRYYEWDGRPIVRLHQSPIYYDDYREIFHDEIQIDMETGVGLQAGNPQDAGPQTAQGADPQIMLQYSDDSGHTWSSERWTKIGKVGEYRTRARWRRMGRSRDRVYRVSVSDPVKVVFIGGRLIYTIGMNP